MNSEKSRESHCQISREAGALSLLSSRITPTNIELLLYKMELPLFKQGFCLLEIKRLLAGYL